MFDRGLALIKRLLGRGNERTHAVMALMACLTLCVCALILAVAGAKGRALPVEFTAVVAALSGLGGWAYGKGKTLETGQGDK